ncbi:MAG: ImmA/IrrE family metallo-endopeptidase [Albidovulum sp.]|nr:ImmA/IrrE family metallo-endopeptidase [Albidovulum sp.]
MIMAEQLETIQSFQKSAPVQTVPIANCFGLEVYKSKPNIWPDSLSGALRRNPEKPESFDIYVNGDHHVNRRRFTIAHEIAHFVLHRDLIGDGISDDALYRSGLSNRVEAQANALAADILMPWHLIDPKIDNGITDIGELAKIFQVSKSAMSIRMGVPYETNR